MRDDAGRSADGRPGDGPTLEMRAARFSALDGSDSEVVLDLAVASGDLVLVEAADEQHERIVTDAVSGILRPLSGEVRFLGRAWSELLPERAAAMRGRIGIAFSQGGWLPHLSLLDNILLVQEHHTRRDRTDLRDEALRLADLFGLPGLPTGPAEDLAREDRQRAALVRAFLGRPRLIVLEAPIEGILPELVGPIVNAARVARDRGAAVIWSLPWDTRLAFDPTLPADTRLRLAGPRFEPLEIAA